MWIADIEGKKMEIFRVFMQLRGNKKMRSL